MAAAERDQYWLAENFMADVRARLQAHCELHLAAGWVPRMCGWMNWKPRCVPCANRISPPLVEISLGEVVAKLFSVARRYELTLQPQLILLQKTLLNIEGMGRGCIRRSISGPGQTGAERILATAGLRRTLRELRTRLPQWLAAAPEMPQLIHTF